ncbi:MAG: hypothetical protein WC829_12630, partial [Hyphomicrobium sp.]
GHDTEHRDGKRGKNSGPHFVLLVIGSGPKTMSIPEPACRVGTAGGALVCMAHAWMGGIVQL